MSSTTSPDVARDIVRRAGVRSRWMGLFALGVLTAIVVLAVFGDLIAPYDPTGQSLADRLRPPAWAAGGSFEHVLGTSRLGEDVLSQLIAGARLTLVIAVSATGIELVLGVLLGLLAAYAGGWVDNLISRLADIQIGFPGTLLVLFVVLVLGAGPVGVIVAVGVGRWMIVARVTRVSVLRVLSQGFVEAARAAGTPPVRLIVKHILPHIRGTLIAVALFELPRMILIEAALSFVGLGVQPPQLSWGLMIQQSRSLIQVAPHLVLFPGFMIILTTVSLTLLAAWLEPRLNPERSRL